MKIFDTNRKNVVFYCKQPCWHTKKKVAYLVNLILKGVMERTMLALLYKLKSRNNLEIGN